MIILHKSNEDITNRIEIICPSNAYSDLSYVSSKKTLVLYVENDNYEPIVQYTLYDNKNAKKYNKKIDLSYFFQEKNTHKHIIKLLLDTKKLYQHHCKPVKSTEELVFSQNIVASKMREHLAAHHYTIDYDIVDYHLKIIGMMVSKHGKRSIVPIYPSNIEIGMPVKFIEDEANQIITIFEEEYPELSKEFNSTLNIKLKFDPTRKIITNLN